LPLDSSNRWLQISAQQCGAYNLHDVYATALVHRALVTEMAKNGDPAYYEREVWPAIPAVLAMQRRGLPVDTDRLHALAREYREELQGTDDDIRAMVGDPDLNLNAPQQRARILFGTLGFTPPKRTTTGKDSTDQDVLDRLYRGLGKRDDRRTALEKLFHRSKVNTIVTRYLTMYPRDGRVFPNVKFCGTETERLAYARPAIQQWPANGRWKRLRSVVRAQPGHLLVAADWKQLEARILAVLAGDTVSLEAFASGRDIHIVNTLDLFGYSEDEFVGMAPTKRSGSRNYSKSFLYKISYGGAADLLKAKAFCPCPLCVEDTPPLEHLTREQAAAAGARWFAKHRPVLTFRRQLERDITARHYWESPLGGRRWLFSPWKEAQREAYNLPMQWIAGQLAKRAIRALHAMGAPLIFNHFDSNVLEVPRTEAESWRARLVEAMEQPVAELGGVVFPTDSAVGERWDEV
jgi:DNA polymerase-1